MSGVVRIDGKFRMEIFSEILMVLICRGVLKYGRIDSDVVSGK